MRERKIKRGAVELKPTGKSDVPLIVCTALLVLFGVLMVYSAGSYTGKRIYGTEFYYV